MRQVWIGSHRAIDGLQVREMPDLAPSMGQVRLRTEAIAASVSDLGGAAGTLSASLRLPFSPGHEVAGVVDLVAQGVSGLKEGDKVFALVPSGGYSSQVCANHRYVFKRLDWMSAEDAAVLPVNYVGAYVMLVIMGSLRRGDRLLIYGVDNELGMALLDVASILGAFIIGTAEQSRHQALLERGLDLAIDPRKFNYTKEVRSSTDGAGVSLVVNLKGGADWDSQYRLLNATGRIIICAYDDRERQSWSSALSRGAAKWTASRLDRQRLMADTKGFLGYNMAGLLSRPSALAAWTGQIVSWYDEALFRPAIDRTFQLGRVKDAHRHLAARNSLGRVLLIP